MYPAFLFGITRGSRKEREGISRKDAKEISQSFIIRSVLPAICP